MRRVAFLFPGQGMECPGMGLSIAEAFSAARDLLVLASDRTGQDLFRLLRRGGPALERTEVLQPCLTAISLGALGPLLTAGLRPELVAGHSVGELPASVAAGCLSAAAAVELACLRGRLMAREAERHPGGMLALLAPDEAVARASGRHQVELAAHNAPGEWVVAGPRPALQALARELPGRWLPVSGAWHSRAMAGARGELEAALRELSPGQAAARVVCNATGQEVAAPGFLPLLAGQLTRPVRWAESMATLASAQVTDLVTVGPGRVLRGLARKNLGSPGSALAGHPSWPAEPAGGTRIRVHSTEDEDDLTRTVELLT